MATAQSEKLMKARCRLVTCEPFYGHFCISMVWTPSDMPWQPNEASKTMGVRILSTGIIECLYYPPFVENMTLEECYAVIQHEIEHLVRCHCIRRGSRDPLAHNIACDFTVNGRKNNPRIGYVSFDNNNTKIIPMKDELCWIPQDWPDNETSEYYYDRLEKMKIKVGCPTCGKGGKGQGNGGGSGKGQSSESGKGQSSESGAQQGTCPACGNSYRRSSGEHGTSVETIEVGRVLDDHSVWDQSEVSADEARQIVKDVTDQAIQKSQGHVPAHLQDAVKALNKPVVRWRELLRHYLGRHVGNHRLTHSRRNRRHDRFGVPGVSHHAAATVNVIVDTSGSISQKELGQFFGEIEAMSARAKVYVLQWDAAFQGFDLYRRGDWKKFKIKGRGGTDMAAPVEYLVTNKLVADCQVMLTDGYCNWASEKPFPMITVITHTGTTEPGWGHVVRLKHQE